MSRILDIGKTLAEYFIFSRYTAHKQKSFGVRMREAAETLGLTFIKIGQLLSTRYDLLPESDCRELQQLLDTAKPLPYEAIREIIKEDFGAYPEHVFSRFNKHPIASASIAQVHKAVYHGQTVAVKIKRPHVEQHIDHDIALLKLLCRIAWPFSRRLRSIAALDLLDQFRAWLLQDADFFQEQRMIVTIKERFGYFAKGVGKGYGKIHFIDCYLCTKNVLIEDFVPGITVNAWKKKPVDGYDVVKSVKTYVISGMLQLFAAEDVYYFPADPHPANVMVMKNGNVANIDYGLFGTLKGRSLQIVKETFLSIYLKDTDRVGTFVRELSGKKKLSKKLRQDIAVFVRSCEGKGIGYWYMGLAKLFIDNHMRMDPTFALFSRCNIMLDGLLETVSPGLTTIALMEKEFRQEIRKRIVQNVKQLDYYSFFYQLSERLKDSPDHVLQIIDALVRAPELQTSS